MVLAQQVMGRLHLHEVVIGMRKRGRRPVHQAHVGRSHRPTSAHHWSSTDGGHGHHPPSHSLAARPRGAQPNGGSLGVVQVDSNFGLLGQSVSVFAHRSRSVVQRLVLLLLGHLLEGEEAVLPHLDPLRHVPHARVLCNDMRESLEDFGFWDVVVCPFVSMSVNVYKAGLIQNFELSHARVTALLYS